MATHQTYHLLRVALSVAAVEAMVFMPWLLHVPLHSCKGDNSVLEATGGQDA